MTSTGTFIDVAIEPSHTVTMAAAVADPDGVGRQRCDCYANIGAGGHSVAEHKDDCSYNGPCGGCLHCIGRQFTYSVSDPAEQDEMMAAAIAASEQRCVDHDHAITMVDFDQGRWWCADCLRFGSV